MRRLRAEVLRAAALRAAAQNPRRLRHPRHRIGCALGVTIGDASLVGRATRARKVGRAPPAGAGLRSRWKGRKRMGSVPSHTSPDKAGMIHTSLGQAQFMRGSLQHSPGQGPQVDAYAPSSPKVHPAFLRPQYQSQNSSMAKMNPQMRYSQQSLRGSFTGPQDGEAAF